MNGAKSQVGDVASLVHMITSGELDGQLKAFLLSCQVSGLSRHSINDYAQKIGYFVTFCHNLDINKPDAVTPTHIRLFILNTQQRCKPVSVKDYYGSVNRFFNWMVEEGVLAQTPMAKMRPPKVPRELIEPFSTEQISNLLELCNNGTFLGLRNRAIILTFLDTGLRLSELANIYLSDIDIDREIIKVMGKGAKERVVRIGELTQKAILHYLLQRKDNLPCLWVSEERTPIQARGIQMMIRRLGRRAGIDNVRCSPHTFRHTFGTRALKLGADIRQVQSLLGHSTLTMTLKYVQTVNSEQAVESHRRFSPVDNMNIK